MKTIKICILIIFLLMLNLMGLSQTLEMYIQTDKTEYKKYSRSSEDSVMITCKIVNTGTKPVIFRMSDEFFDIGSFHNGSEYDSHCLRVYPYDYYKPYREDYNRTADDFVTINAGNEITRTEAYAISWICRGTPTEKEWNLTLSYNRTITSEDNYIKIKSNYADKYYKEFVEDAWTGTITSDTVKISIK